MIRDTTAESPEIATRQSCCGAGTTQQEATCCGSETRQQESGCGGDSEAENASCCDEQTVDEDAGTPAGNGRKSASEHERIRDAAEQTEALLSEMTDIWAPDWTERDVVQYLHNRMDELGYDPAWTAAFCPAVHAGPEAEIGHTLPEDRTLQPGEVLHVDFGVSVEGYAADLQRVYYYPTELESSVPADLRDAFGDVRAALDAGLDALKPGVRGHEVDAEARAELADRGWAEFGHAFGHQVGRDAHDGGTLLSPQWDRYGDRPRGEVQAGEVYSVELGVGTTYGYVGQEEMVRVVDDGVEFLVEPQTDIRSLER